MAYVSQQDILQDYMKSHLVIGQCAEYDRCFINSILITATWYSEWQKIRGEQAEFLLKSLLQLFSKRMICFLFLLPSPQKNKVEKLGWLQ
jgi:hypothetical protein